MSAAIVSEIPAGSSPLARGLLRVSFVFGPRLRIIPARAGFTTHRLLSGSARSDHPRSRGVYWGLTQFTGSAIRIIPARAGFTSRRLWRRPPVQDHPRSRGVYSSDEDWVRACVGSSPLARGLRPPLRGRGRDDGIIPARAGFTCAVHSRRPSWPDHPRSRGVYEIALPTAGPFPGSSPLARGLHGFALLNLAERRIIPARAGFTTHNLLRYREP